ncbi:probable helicase [Natronomonas pharaonis DSM 2160]|uniref:DNA 3'-5' helicase n=1 Tax=Natronomonas pharaonis (strain ATCC 35678 / DSM 2160 / CIP 103997 / JCM 8858 / NBRC 14720 / NCIMB 2260 / Gabara) TaxID=348780 RepID=A0A1U7EXV8_NATPD|nr:UvrD-helicase domain-containing protein [Natronomonas pharaonis]CAI50023.1 probable helicase [Natronomonas pharaonis DSM 2160]
MTWEELQHELKRDERRWGRRFLPQAVHIRLFGDPEQQRRRYEVAREQVKTRYDELHSTIDDNLQRLHTDLSPAIEDGQSIDASPKYEKTLQHLRDDLDSFHVDLDEQLSVDRPPEAFLRSEEQQTLEDWKRQHDQLESFLKAKVEFDDRMPAMERTVERLYERTECYRSYDQYLTRPEQTEINERCRQIRDQLDRLRNELNLDLLADTDRHRLSDVETTLDAIIEHLQDYNNEFVDRRCAEYDDLFSDIDEEGNDLNRAQREAVVTNDLRNLVVAAAGTGKTLALTYRVAYLVAEGVDPARIAALTYTRQAAREMELRLEEQFGIEQADVRTIHSFAYEIAQETADGYLDVADSQDLYNLIDEVIREARNGQRERFFEHYTQFLFHYDHTHLEEADFDSRTNYVAKRSEESYETLAGETVASRAERVIADFLFTHDVTYQYEAVATWADSADDKGEYRPDFYLPEYDLYIEHWGLDRNGEVSPWFSWSTDQYHEKLFWAREEFVNNDRSLIETYEFEYEAGRLKAALQHRLEHAGVELRRLDFEEFVNQAFEYNKKERDIKESLASFVHNAKTFRIDADDARSRLTPTNARKYHFGHCGAFVLEAYNAYLDRAGLVDFDDMINEAIAAIQADPESYWAQFDHLLVDEFQDVSRHQLELIRAFTGGEDLQETPRLFCVGDDWQSIYSFQGADVDQFIAFEENFGPTAETRLTENYRNPVTVLEAGNDLIANNDHQIAKTVRAAAGHDCQPTLHVLDGYTENAYERRVGEYAANLVEQRLEKGIGTEPSDAMVLCRYDAGAPFTDRVKAELERRNIPYDGKDDHYRPEDMPDEYDPDFDPDAGVAVYSVHQAKGREAEQLIVLNVVSGMYGFPADHRENSLVAPVQDLETATVEEERRLFYVALTRAESEMHVLTRGEQWSLFIEEIKPYLTLNQSVASLSPSDEEESITAKVQLLWDDLHETQHQAGVLEDQSGTIRFVSWATESPPTVKEEVWYRFESIEINEFNGDTQVQLGTETTAMELYRADQSR